MPTAIQTLTTNIDVFFLTMGAILVFAMHGGFAFLEVGSVRHKNQVNALVKILSDFAVSVIAYFFLGYFVAYGIDFFSSAKVLTGQAEGSSFAPSGYDLIKFFFLATFAAAIPAIISGGIAERARFGTQILATFLLVAIFYPIVEGIFWGGRFGVQDFLEANFGASFHDFAGSGIVHGFGGWVALVAVMILGARNGRYKKDGRIVGILPSSIPFLALGTWMLCIGWFGFNVISAATIEGISGLVALNSLMAMVGGILASLWIGKNDPGFVHNGALAGLVAVCSGSDIFHPIGALIVGGVAGIIFVYMFNMAQNKLKIDDVLGVWPLHGLAGIWGVVATGIFGQEMLQGLGGVSLISQLIGSILIVAIAIIAGLLTYGLINKFSSIRLDEEEEFNGADLSIHKISATPEQDIT